MYRVKAIRRWGFEWKEKSIDFDYDRLGYQQTPGFGVNKPFGSNNRKWNEDDIHSLTTNKILPDKWINNNLIDLDFSEIESQTTDPSLLDIGPIQNYGILIDDYKINYTENPIEVNKSKPTVRTKIGKDKKGQAY